MKQLINSFIILVFFTTVLMITEGCKPEPLVDIDKIEAAAKGIAEVLTRQKRDSLDSLIRTMSLLPTISPISPTPIGSPRDESGNPDTLYCQLQNMKWAAGDEDALLLDPSNDIIFPGSLIESSSIADGSYRPIIFPRRKMIISTSLTNVKGSPKDTIQDPSRKSSAQEAINSLFQRGINGKIPANMTKEVKQVYSLEQASVAIGANFNGWGAKVAAKFNWSNKKIKQRFVVKFYQKFCDVSVDLPKNPNEIFDSLPKPTILGSYSPVYVSNIKYGRVVLFLWETESEDTDIKASLDASYNSLAAGGSISVDTKFRDYMKKSSMQVLAFGGNPDEAAKITNPETLQKFIENSANFTPESQGVMIGYTLRFLKDNSIAKIVKAAEYTVRSCEYVPEKLHEFVNQEPYDFGVDLISGDGEYGNEIDDPDLKIKGDVSLYTVNDNEVWMKVFIKFQEQKPDFTTGLTDKKVKLFTIPAGYKINKIMTSSNSSIEFNDKGWSPDVFDRSNYDLVKKYIINGDNKGVDLPGTKYGENRSWVRLYLNKVTVSMLKIR
jgi:thiol-activated cytolysin